MKKRMLCAGALIGASSFLLLSGFDSAETAESILEKNRTASADISSASYDVDMNADVTLDISSLGMTVNLAGSGEASVAAVKDPLSFYFDGTFSGQAMGQSGQITVGSYLVTEEDGSLTFYTGSDSIWSKQTVAAEDVQQFNDLIKDVNVNYAEMPISFVLADEASDVDGVECYQLKASLNWDDVKQILVWSSEQAMSAAEELAVELETEPEVMGTSVSDAEEQLDAMLEQLSVADPYVEGLLLNITLDISCDTFEAQRVYIDMDGSDWSNVIAFLVESGLVSDNDGSDIEVNLDVKDLHIAIQSTGAPEEITVPQEVADFAVDVADTEDIEVSSEEEYETGESNTMTYAGVTFTFDENAFDYFYTDENYIGASSYDTSYSIYARVSEYTDTEEDIREEQEWDASYYAENYEKYAVSDVETITYDDGTTRYDYSVSYENTENEYAAITYSVYLINAEGQCICIQADELADTLEDLTLTQEKVDELLSQLTIAW